ncbi:MAG TPA: hypothetical protein VGB85_04180, partial [Nannocystis sp.]
IALPFTRDGLSLLDVFLRIAADSPLAGLAFLIMFAAPQLFGLAVAVARLVRDESIALALVQIPVAILQAMTVLFGMSLINNPKAVAPLALAGFALVSALYYLYTSSEAAAADRPLRLRWYIRWGALLVAGLGMWLRLQALGSLRLGVALDVAVVTAVLLLASTAPRRPAIA